MRPVERFLEALLANGCELHKRGKSWSACCPAHDDQRASLSIDEGDDGKVLIHCFAGCNTDAICAKVGLTLRDLMPADSSLPRSHNSRNSVSQPSQGVSGNIGSAMARIVAEYDYRDETGALVFQVVRREPKDFRQRRPASAGDWDWSVKGVRVVPYHLAELTAEPTQPVVIVEGEKDADNLAAVGVLATCNAGGAGKWTPEHAAFLAGRRCIVLADNDDPGRKHSVQVALSLQGCAESVRIVELPGLKHKGDVSDWLAAGGTKGELERLANLAPEWTPIAAETWPEIVPFDALNLPDFPTHALPDTLRRWVEAESHAKQTPSDLAALLSLAVCGAAIARKVVVEPCPGWCEPTNLFATVLLEPGNRKSAVFADATQPLRELETELIDAERAEVARAQSERRQDERRLQRLEKLAAENGDAEARQEAAMVAADLAEKTEPVLPRLFVDDATAEKLGMMLAEQGGRIASMSAEGGVFDLMAGLYSKSGAPQFGIYLLSHAGDDVITDRVSRDSVRVERPALTCAYTIQPQVIKGLAGNPAFRGRGLLARFLYAFPQSWIGRREIAPAPVSAATSESYRRVVKNLAGVNCEYVLRLTDEASSVFREWEAEIESMLGDGGQMESMRDWGAKLAGATLRLAAVLHCVQSGPTGTIQVRTIAAAVEIARYLIPHAEAVLNLMAAKDGTGDADACYVLRWIERHGRREFTKRDAQQHGKRRFPKADGIDVALAELKRRGFIRLRPAAASGPGRPPSPVYEVNPAAFTGRPEYCSHSSHNSPGVPIPSRAGIIGSDFDQTESANRVQVTI